MRFSVVAGFAMLLGFAVPSGAQYSAAVMANRGMILGMDSEFRHRSATDFRWMSGPDLERQIDFYRKETERYRQNALHVASQSRTVRLPPGSGSRIRAALQADIDFWRDEVQVGGHDYQDMTKQWLLPVNSLDDQQWAMQRANWFAARDRWLTMREASVQNARP